jgi:hypothetical protein
MNLLVLLAAAFFCLIGVVICTAMKTACNEAQVYGEHLIHESQKAQKELQTMLDGVMKPCQGVKVDALPQELQIAVLSQATMESDEFERFMQRLHSTEDPK